MRLSAVPHDDELDYCDLQHGWGEPAGMTQTAVCPGLSVSSAPASALLATSSHTATTPALNVSKQFQSYHPFSFFPPTVKTWTYSERRTAS